jgi:hypothetical protein
VNISWFDALGTFTYKRSATPYQPFFLFTCPCCLFFSLSYGQLCIHTLNSKRYFFSLSLLRPTTRTYILYARCSKDIISLSFFFFFFLCLVPSLGKQTRLVRRTKYSLPGSHTPAELILGVTSM